MLGLALAVGALSLYRKLAGLDASAAVQGVLQHYTAPGVRLGARVREVRATVKAPLTFVPHLGFIANPQDRSGVSQVRLLLSAEDRERQGDDGDRVDAIELVTAAKDASATLLVAVAGRFPGAPHEGCVSVGGDDYHREVRYWAVPGDHGGVAVISDFGGDPSIRHGEQVVVSLLAFAGRFDGGRTLRATYAAKSCAQLVGIVP